MFERFEAFLGQNLTYGVGVFFLFVALIFQALWNFYHHLKRREYFPKIEFLCDILFKAQTETHWVIEIVCAVRNKGVAGHKARNLTFRVHGLRTDDRLEDGPSEINNQLNFPHVVRSGVWQRRRELNDLIEAGTTQYYRHVGIVPKNNYLALVVHGSMQYPQTRSGKLVTHTCNRLVRVPETQEEALAYSEREMDRLQFAQEFIHVSEVALDSYRARR